MSAGLEAVEAYLAPLPEGLDSYPECGMKGATVRAYLGGLPAFTLSPDLPEPIAALFHRPPKSSAWVPEVVCHALITYVAFDVLGGEQAYLEHVHRTNYALFTSLAYRVLFKVLSPKQIVTQASARWDVFHTGTTLEPVGKIGRKGGKLAMRGPPHHWSPLLSRGYASSFRAAAEAGGARDVGFEITADGPGGWIFDARWR